MGVGEGRAADGTGARAVDAAPAKMMIGVSPRGVAETLKVPTKAYDASGVIATDATHGAIDVSGNRRCASAHEADGVDATLRWKTYA